MAKAGIAVLAAVMVPVLAVGLLLWVLFFGAAAAAACGGGVAGQIDIDSIPADAKVGAFGRDQIVNAALIANASTAKAMPQAAQTLGVQTAIGESSLVNIDYGDWETSGVRNPDGSPTTSIGLFQQQDSWGTPQERMDPTTSATLFFDRLATVEGWEALDPSIAINKVQRNSDPYHYTKYRADAVAIMAYLAGLTGTGPSAAPTATPPSSTVAPIATPGCAAVSGDAQALAAGLAAAMDAGDLRVMEDRYAQQIRDLAAGTATETCGIDVRILQVITIALNTFGQVGVSDLNRQCVGDFGGAGTNSAHWFDGGGHAVDFTSFGGTVTTGCDANAIRLLDILDPQVPAGSMAGQTQCRSTSYQHIVEFNDPATHLHFDVGYADGPLTSG